MTELKYIDRASILIAVSERNVRNNIKTILHNGGFREMDFCTTLEEVEEKFEAQMPDLLFCSTSFEDGKASEFIYGLRHNHVGENPFLPVIVVTPEPSPRQVRRIIDSGADDLLVMPLSTKQVLDRVKALVHNRKPFVVTSDYIGPDRRKRDRTDAEQIPKFEVPNVLKDRIQGTESSPVKIQDAIDNAFAKINLEKLERHAVQIAWIVNRIENKLVANIVDVEVSEALERLFYVLSDTHRRLAGTRYAHVSGLCRTMLRVTKAIRASVDDVPQKSVKLLRPLSQAITNGFETDTAQTAREISAQVDGWKTDGTAAGGADLVAYLMDAD